MQQQQQKQQTRSAQFSSPQGSPKATALTRKISSILQYSSELQLALQDARDAYTIRASDDLDHYIQIIQDPVLHQTTRFAQHSLKDLERHGTDIWNQCIRLRRDATSGPNPNPSVLCRARLFALFLLDISWSNVTKNNKSTAERDRLLPLAIILSKICTDENNLATARVALQKVAEYLEPLKTANGEALPRTKPEKWKHLEDEYFILRIILASKDGKPDVVEHMFTKLKALLPSTNTATTDMIIETLNYLGGISMASNDYDSAYKWYLRADDLYRNATQRPTNGRLRRDIYQGLIKCLATKGSAESSSEVHKIISAAAAELGDHPGLLHLQLDIAERSSDASSIETSVKLINLLIETDDVSGESLDGLLYRIDKLSERHLAAARDLLDKILADDMFLATKPYLFEKAFVARFKYITGCENLAESLQPLERLLNHFPSNTAISIDAAQAIHGLIWDPIRNLYTSQEYSQAKVWCQLGFHPLLQTSGEANLGVIGRKMIMCDMELGNYEEARRNFNKLPESTQNDMLSRYLMFRIALQTWDQSLGYESIKSLCAHGDKESTRNVLYACIRDAQHAGDKLCTLAALKAILQTWDDAVTVPASLPSVLRCIIRLLFLIESQTKDGESSTSFADEVAAVFKQAATHVERGVTDESNQAVFTVPELAWLRKNAYNTGVTGLGVWNAEHIVSIFTSCLSFINAYPDSTQPDQNIELGLMAARCHFVISTALTSQSRETNNNEFYKKSRTHIASYQILFHNLSNNVDEPTQADLAAKLGTLAVFDFEAATNLKQYDIFSQIIQEAASYRDVVAFKAMGDCILHSKAPPEVMFSTMKSIINEIYTLDSFDNTKLAKYIRCVFQALLPQDETLAMQMLDHAVQVASESAEVGKHYPSVEVEWLSATAFNHGIDLYIAHKHELCRAWVLKAIELAGYMDDGCVFKSTLSEKLNKLSLPDVSN